MNMNMNRQQCEDRLDYLCIWEKEQYELKDVTKELLSFVVTAFSFFELCFVRQNKNKNLQCTLPGVKKVHVHLIHLSLHQGTQFQIVQCWHVLF